MLLQGGGVHWISSGSDDQRTFWSLKCSILGFFFFGWGGGWGGVGKYWLVFWGELDLSRGFWDIQNNLKIHDSCII